VVIFDPQLTVKFVFAALAGQPDGHLESLRLGFKVILWPAATLILNSTRLSGCTVQQ